MLPLTGVADLEPGDLVGVVHPPLLRLPLDTLQHAARATEPHSGQTAGYQVSSVTSLLDTGEFSSFLPVWTLSAIEQLGDVLCEFSDMFSTSKTDFGSWSLMPFEISVSEGSAPVTSRPHRVNPMFAKGVDATLKQYLAKSSTGLIQYSTSPYSSPLVVIPKKSGGVRITVHKLNQVSKLSQLPIPRVDQVLDSLGSGRMFSLFDLVSSFYQIKGHKDTVPLQRSAHPRVSTSGSLCLRAAALRLVVR